MRKGDRGGRWSERKVEELGGEHRDTTVKTTARSLQMPGMEGNLEEAIKGFERKTSSLPQPRLPSHTNRRTTPPLPDHSRTPRLRIRRPRQRGVPHPRVAVHDGWAVRRGRSAFAGIVLLSRLDRCGIRSDSSG